SADLDRASRVLDGLGAKAPTGAESQVIRAQVRLLEGRPGEDVLALLPEGARSVEMRAITALAPVWQDAKAALPDGSLSELDAIAEPRGLALSAKGLALYRAGDEDAAREVAKRLEAMGEDQAVAKALFVRVGRGEGE